MNKALIVLCVFFASIAIAGPSILQIYQGGTGATNGAQALINLIGGSPSAGNALVWTGSAWVPGSGGSVNNSYNTPAAASAVIPYYGLNAWFSADCTVLADAGTCATLTNGTSLDIWQDRSGNGGFAVAQTTSCVLNTAQINSQPAVTFTGSCGRYLFNTNLQNVNLWRDAITMFVVAKAGSTGSAFAFLGGTTSSDIEYRDNGTKQQEILKRGTSSLGEGTAASDTSWHQTNVACTTTTNIAASTQPVFRIAQASDATLGNPTIVSCSTLIFNSARVNVIGESGNNTELFSGSIAEILIYGRILSSTETTNVEGYLHTKYGL